MTERKVGTIQITGHRHHADLGRLLKEYQIYEGANSSPLDPMRKYYFPLTKPKDNPITVKGNGRQEVVQGKRHSWPVAKKRKGK